MKKTLILCAMLMALSVFVNAQSSILYVDQAASGLNDGSDWDNAYTSLKTALSAATYGNEIWVAKGTYYSYIPNIPDTTYSFNMVSGVKLYGGFAGGETSITERNVDLNETVLSGRYWVDGNILGVPNVVYCTNTDSNTVLDGFVIQDSWADIFTPLIECSASGVDESACHGGGLYVYGESPAQATHLSLYNCTFLNNRARYGGGMAVNFTNGPGQVLIQNCRFIQNFCHNSIGFGGGIFIVGESNLSYSVVIDSCYFFENGGYVEAAVAVHNLSNAADITIQNSHFEANHSLYNGGCISIQNASSARPRIKNCLIVDNQAGNLTPIKPGAGGALLGQKFHVNQCIFVNNRATSGGAAQCGSAKFFNCLFFDNFSIKRGGAITLVDTNYVISCTFLRNRTNGTGSAIQGVSSKSDTIINCVFYENVALEDSQTITSSKGFLDYSAVDAPDCLVLSGGGNFSCGSHVLYNVDPVFSDTISGDFHPAICSPLVDAGDSTWMNRFQLELDVDGHLRMLHTQIDIGAYETPMGMLAATVSVQAASSAAASDGAAELATVTGGMAPYFIEWSTGDTTQAVEGLAPGFYTVTVRDANGCDTTIAIEIQYTVNTGDLPAAPDLQCLSRSSGPEPSATLVVGQAGQYQLTLWNAVGQLQSTGRYFLETGTVSVPFPRAPAGTYFLQIIDVEGHACGCRLFFSR